MVHSPPVMVHLVLQLYSYLIRCITALWTLALVVVYLHIHAGGRLLHGYSYPHCCSSLSVVSMSRVYKGHTPDVTIHLVRAA